MDAKVFQVTAWRRLNAEMCHIELRELVQSSEKDEQGNPIMVPEGQGITWPCPIEEGKGYVGEKMELAAPMTII